MAKKDLKCQCPINASISPEREYLYSEKEKSGMNHKPNECKGTNDIKLYKRDGEELYLCSCCCFSGDIEIKKKK